MLTIKSSFKRDNVLVVFNGNRYRITVKAEQVNMVVAHHFGLDTHVEGECPVCKDLKEREERANKRP